MEASGKPEVVDSISDHQSHRNTIRSSPTPIVPMNIAVSFEAHSASHTTTDTPMNAQVADQPLPAPFEPAAGDNIHSVAAALPATTLLALKPLPTSKPPAAPAQSPVHLPVLAATGTDEARAATGTDEARAATGTDEARAATLSDHASLGMHIASNSVEESLSVESLATAKPKAPPLTHAETSHTTTTPHVAESHPRATAKSSAAPLGMDEARTPMLKAVGQPHPAAATTAKPAAAPRLDDAHTSAIVAVDQTHSAVAVSAVVTTAAPRLDDAHTPVLKVVERSSPAAVPLIAATTKPSSPPRVDDVHTPAPKTVEQSPAAVVSTAKPAAAAASAKPTPPAAAGRSLSHEHTEQHLPPKKAHMMMLHAQQQQQQQRQQRQHAQSAPAAAHAPVTHVGPVAVAGSAHAAAHPSTHSSTTHAQTAAPAPAPTPAQGPAPAPAQQAAATAAHPQEEKPQPAVLQGPLTVARVTFATMRGAYMPHFHTRARTHARTRTSVPGRTCVTAS